MKKWFTILLSGLILISVAYFIGSGFNVREDVYLVDYIVPPYKNEMTIAVGVASSAGYTRTVKNVSDNPEVMQLQFYSAFGGINGSVCEDHRFVIDITPECKEIYFYRGEEFELILYKNEASGEWELAK